MDQDSLKMFSFFLKLVLLLELISSINQLQLGANAIPQPEFYERISKIEANNRLQANEISLLKTKSIEDRSEIHHLRERVAKLEASTFTNDITNCQEISKRQKRPDRLIPAHIFKYIRYICNFFKY